LCASALKNKPSRVETCIRFSVLSLRRSSNFPSCVRQILSVVGPLLICATTGLAQKYPSVTLSWDSSLDQDLAGRRIYGGPASADYPHAIDGGELTVRPIPLLAGDGTYFFAVTAYNYDGLESEFSNEVSFTPIVLNIAMDTSSAVNSGPPGQNTP